MRKVLGVLAALGVSFGGVENWLQNAVYELEKPAVLDAQAHRLYYGGGFRLRTNDASFQPFTVIPPRLEAGCGGIDLVFGGFGYFQPEYLVKFGEQIIQQAPAFAFKIALETFCPSCQKIMTELENLANQINSLSLSSCQLANSLKDFVVPKLREMTGNVDVAAGVYESLLHARDALKQKTSYEVVKEASSKGLTSEITNLILTLRATKNPVYFTDLLKARADSGKASSLFKDPVVLDFVKVTVGDVEINVPADGRDVLVRVVPPGDNADVKTLVGGKAPTQPCFTTGCKSLKEALVDPKLDGIVDKILNRIPLSDGELEFLAMFPLPAYKLLNRLSISPGLLLVVKEDLSKWMAYELAKYLFTQLLFHYHALLGELATSEIVSEKDEENLRAFVQSVSQKAQNLYAIISGEQDQIISRIQNGLKLVEEFEKLAAREYLNSPVYGSYLFWQGIPVR